jgi:hypothetical protein
MSSRLCRTKLGQFEAPADAQYVKTRLTGARKPDFGGKKSTNLRNCDPNGVRAEDKRVVVVPGTDACCRQTVGHGFFLQARLHCITNQMVLFLRNSQQLQWLLWIIAEVLEAHVGVAPSEGHPCGSHGIMNCKREARAPLLCRHVY